MPDYIFMLESRLMPDQIAALNFLQEEAQDTQLNLYLAGGAVRDLMTGLTIRDLDFVFEGNPLKLVKRFEDPAPVRVDIDEKMKRAEIILASGVRLSLEMARSEAFDKPGGEPEIRPATIIDDLRRRDFTINSMAISLTPGSRGLLLDPTNGLADIESRELRTLHNYSFLHDPSRLLRMVRYGSRLGFKAEGRTREQFESAMQRKYLSNLDPRHLGPELSQIAREPNLVAVLKAFQVQGLLEVFHSSLQRRKPDYDSLGHFQKGCATAEESGYRIDPLHGALHYILRKMPPTDAGKLLKRAGWSATEIKDHQKWMADVKQVIAALGRVRSNKAVPTYRLLEKVPVALQVFILTEYKKRGRIHSRIQTHLYKHRPMRHTLPEAELESLDVQRGTFFDKVMEEFFELRIEGRIRSNTNILKVLRKLAGIPEPKPEPPPKPEEPKAEEPEKKPRRSTAAKEEQRSKVRKALLKKMSDGPKGKSPVKAARPGKSKPVKKPPATKKTSKPKKESGHKPKTKSTKAASRAKLAKAVKTALKKAAAGLKRPGKKPAKKRATGKTGKRKGRR